MTTGENKVGRRGGLTRATIIGALTLAVGVLPLAGCGANTQNSPTPDNATTSTAVSTENTAGDTPPEAGLTRKGEQLTPSSVTPQGAVQITKIHNLHPDAIRVDVFVDPSCGGCQLVDSELNDQWKREAQEGRINLFVTFVPFLDHDTVGDYSTRASSAFLTVAEHDPMMALDFMGELFSDDFFSGHGLDSVHRPTSDRDLADLADKVGAPQDIQDSIMEQHYVDWVRENTDSIADNKVIFPEGLGTPTVVLGLSFDKDGTALTGQQVKFTRDFTGDYERAREDYVKKMKNRQ